MAVEDSERLQKYIDTELLHRPDKLLAGKSALITGATRPNGIGFAIAERFALEGASPIILVGTERSQDIAPSLGDRLKRYGMEAYTLVGDVTSKDSCVEIMKKAYEICNVDILVNNAGATRDKPFTDITVADWDDVVRTKLLGSFLMTQEWFRIRNEEKNLRGGTVINIGSVIGIYGNFGQEIYAMANSGLIGFTKAKSWSLGRWGITVNLIAPGFVEGTDMTREISKEEMEGVKAVSAIPELVRPEDIAAAALYLAGPYGGRITGAILPIDCGIQSNYTAARKMHQAGFRQIPVRIRSLVGELLSLPPEAVAHFRRQIQDHRQGKDL